MYAGFTKFRRESPLIKILREEKYLIRFTEEDAARIELKDDENPTFMELLILCDAGKISHEQRYRLCQLMEEGYIISPYARFRMDGTVPTWQRLSEKGRKKLKNNVPFGAFFLKNSLK